MNEQTMRPVTLLIAALGGEGGGVLTGWIVAAAEAAGLPVQATSIPGVAQRTGATTYYIEIWPEPMTGKRPVLSLSPAPGEVDVFATTELLEAGRAVGAGFVTPDRTQVISSRHRVYTTREKMAPGDGRFDDDALVKGLRVRSQTTHLIDMDAVARENGTHISAVLLGAIAGAGVLPLSVQAFGDAVRAGGKAVDANLRGFAAGQAAVGGDNAMADDVPQPLEGMIELAVARAQDFQGASYGELLLKRLQPFRDGNTDLAVAVLKGLARRMVYNDIIRVAALKTRKGRVGELRAEVGAGKGDVVRVRDYFRPGAREVADILPPVLGRLLRGGTGWRLTLERTSVTGSFALALLAWLRPLRRFSARFRAEQAAIETWLADIAAAREKDPALALEVARNVRLIKGYGATHARGLETYDAIRAELVAPALEGGHGDPAEIAAARDRALSDRSR